MSNSENAKNQSMTRSSSKPDATAIGWSKFEMADQVVELLENDSSLNLGIGMPTLIAERIQPEKNITIHSENGVLGVSGRPSRASVSQTLINAGKETISIGRGASFFDSATSFGMIRGGHIDCCVLGGMQVDVEGNLANWMVPGKKITGMGGAMDLVHGAKQIIVMLSHFSKDGQCKLVRRCDLPLTGLHVAHKVVTDRGLFEITGSQFRLLKLAPRVQPTELGISHELLSQ